MTVNGHKSLANPRDSPSCYHPDLSDVFESLLSSSISAASLGSPSQGGFSAVAAFNQPENM